MRIYYCSKCSTKKEVHTNKDMVCDCGHVFGTTHNISTYINMRNSAISHTTQIEMSDTTIDEDIKRMNNNRRMG